MYKTQRVASALLTSRVPVMARLNVFLLVFGFFLGPVAGAEWSSESGPKSINGIEKAENRDSSRIRADRASATV